MTTTATAILIAMAGILAQEPPSSAESDASRDAARAQGQEAAQATINEDWETLVRLTHPRIVELAGGRDKMIALLRKQIGAMKEEGVVLQSSRVRRPDRLVSEGDGSRGALWAVVPTTHTIRVPGGVLTSDSYLLGHSRDAGAHWTFIDSSPGSAKIREIFPEIPEALELPERGEPRFTPGRSGSSSPSP